MVATVTMVPVATMVATNAPAENKYLLVEWADCLGILCWGGLLFVGVEVIQLGVLSKNLGNPEAHGARIVVSLIAQTERWPGLFSRMVAPKPRRPRRVVPVSRRPLADAIGMPRCPRRVSSSCTVDRAVADATAVVDHTVDRAVAVADATAVVPVSRRP